MTKPSPLLEFRKSIDNLDATLIYVLAERFRLTKRVGEYKRDNGLPSSDKGREGEQIARLKALAIDADLERFWFILRQRLRRHDMFDFTRADAERECAERAVRRGVAVAADDRHAGLREALFRAHDVNDALPE